MKIRLQNKHIVNNINCKHYFFFAIKVMFASYQIEWERKYSGYLYSLEKEFVNFCIFKSL